ncbi:hypothetical protein FSA05_14575 [Parabacteroides distasonis]|jgi:hypothetical protein|uniref:Putative carbohydrate metabolism domain-containing protein n=2 Tax=Parabacteroides distasonis TaxID=823 RepID=A0A5C6KFM2_PARDI|nr:hypothetical protein FSA05_14575 [Parabacteroides distasonis]
MRIMRLHKLFAFLSACVGLTACIENDIPYPIVEGSITAMKVEGQIGTEEINTSTYTAAITVNDSVDVRKLRVTQLRVSSNATIIPDSSKCLDIEKFPTEGFGSLDSIPRSSNTRIDFSKPVSLTLRTYQDYKWTVTVSQTFERTIEVENQIGNATIDAQNCQVIIYVAKEQALDKIKVTKMDLGGKYGTVTPAPTTVTDFMLPKTFTVYRHGIKEDAYKEIWTVSVFNADDDTPTTSGDTFAMATKATISGSVQSGKTPMIEYKKTVDSDWSQVPATEVNVNGTSFTTTLGSLTPGTSYTYRISVDNVAVKEVSFTTAEAIALAGGNLDNWHVDPATAGSKKELWRPWASGGTSFWDTGNKGATTIGTSNSLPTDDTSNGSGKAAKLESKYLLIKLAAGNIFTGVYKETDGTNGILTFGREFTSFPSKLRFHYKYTSTMISKVGDNDFQYLKGRPDSCCVYIALTDWSAPKEIRTNPSTRVLFDKSDKNIIAYGEFVSSESTSAYQQLEIPLEYRYENRTPKYIVVVATASKYGDYFTGGDGSTLWLDNLELVYD